jgi:hypothetical protein
VRGRLLAKGQHIQRRQRNALLFVASDRRSGPTHRRSSQTCRHGGMTELEEAELTDGQGRALSAHKSRAYEGYAKRTMERALAAIRKRHAHRIASLSNAQGAEFRNEAPAEFRNTKETRRQHAVITSTSFSGNRPKVKAGPRKAIQFVQTDPVPAIVQSEGSTYARRDLAGGCRSRGG